MHHGDKKIAGMTNRYVPPDPSLMHRLVQQLLEVVKHALALRHALLRRREPRNRTLEGQLVEFRVLLGELHVGRQPGGHTVPERVELLSGRMILVRPVAANARQKERVVEGSLIGEVFIERRRLELYPPRYLPQAQPCYPTL